ncbi:MAG TPA: response regulator [Candidatus Polarisedimenticolaceae bacterium]
MANVLVIDAHPEWRSRIAAVLEEDGHTARMARDGVQGLQEAATSLPDLVVMDVRLPAMDGLDVMSRLLDRYRKLPIVLHTDCVATRDNFMSWCADAFIAKEPQLLELRRTVHDLVGQPG